MELHNQAKELRVELERKEAELKELHLSKLSLQVCANEHNEQKDKFLAWMITSHLNKKLGHSTR